MPLREQDLEAGPREAAEAAGGAFENRHDQDSHQGPHTSAWDGLPGQGDPPTVRTGQAARGRRPHLNAARWSGQEPLGIRGRALRPDPRGRVDAPEREERAASLA